MNGLRKEQFLGNEKYILGDSGTDLVLETLGKVYVKIGNQTKVLSDVLSLLDSTTSETISNTTIVEGTDALTNLTYPGDGYFVYDSENEILYICSNNTYVALISKKVNSSSYVLKSGDTMTGPLSINTTLAPLIVASSKLVNNLNVQYLNGYESTDFIRSDGDLTITGKWKFASNITFSNNVIHYGDIVTNKSISSPLFSGGFNGYGWRIDGDTGTLTIDNLIVRKAMQVYELVVNKISATNGSIWVSNSSKCDTVETPKIINQTMIDTSGLSTTDALLSILAGGGYFIVDSDDNKTIVSKTSEISSSQSINTSPVNFTCYKYMAYVKDAAKLVNCSLFTGLSTLYNHTLVNLSSYVSGTTNYSADLQELKSYLSIFPIYQSVSYFDETTGLHTYSNTFNLNTNFFVVYDSTTFENTGNGIVGIQPYYKYFASGTELTVVTTSTDEYPLLKPGDLIRCQKFTNGNIKYYDAIVLNQLADRTYILQKSPSVFDQYTEVKYNNDGTIFTCTLSYNDTQYNKSQTSYNPNTGNTEYTSIDYSTNDNYTVTESNRNDSSKLADSIDSGDSLVQMGNIEDISRQNSIYLTSTDDQGPYIDIISDLNRPDYSVLYRQPIFDTISYICNNSSRIHAIDNSKYLGIQNKYYHQSIVPSIDYIDIYNVGQESNSLSVTINYTGTSTASNTNTVTNTRSDGSLALTSISLGGANTASPDVTVSIVYTAPFGHPIQYMLSESSTFANGVWYDIKDNIHFTLSKTTGTKTVYVKLFDTVAETSIKYYGTLVPTINSTVVQSDGKYQSDYTKTTKVRLGNLDGIFDRALGTKQPYGFGLYGQNVFLTGEFYLNNGKSVVDFSQDGIKEYYKSAGLTIGDITDTYGTPTGEVGIVMDASRFIWNITKPDGSILSKAMSLFIDEYGNINLDVQGWIQSNGLYIKNTNGVVTTSILSDGTFNTINGTLSNVTAENFTFKSGVIGGEAPSPDNGYNPLLYTINSLGLTATSLKHSTNATMLLDNSKLKYNWNGTVYTVNSDGTDVISVPASYLVRFGDPTTSGDYIHGWDTAQMGLYINMLYPTEYTKSYYGVSASGNNCNIGMFLSVTGAKSYDDEYSISGNHAIYAQYGDFMGLRLHLRRVRNTTSATTVSQLSIMDSVIFIVGGNSGEYDPILQLPDNCESGQVFIIKGTRSSRDYSIQTYPKDTNRDQIWWATHNYTYNTGSITDAKTYTLIYDSLNHIWGMSISSY